MNVPTRLCSLVVVAALAVGGCAKTNLTNLYKDPSYPTAPLDKFIVIAVERSQDLRRMWEQAIAAELQSRGIMATPSYHMFPGSLPDSQQVRVVIDRDNLNGAVVSHRLDATQVDVGGGYDKKATMTPGNYWSTWYLAYYQTVTLGSPPPDREKKGRYQIDVWSARDGERLVWRGSTVEIDPTSVDKLREEVVDQLVPELQRQRIIPGD